MRRYLPWALLVVASCVQSPPPPPGDERMGTFEFTAQVVTLPEGGLDPAWQDCQTPARGDAGISISELPASDFSFEATLTQDRASGHTWLTIGDVSRDASFDGQYVDSTFTAQRTFKNCCGDKGQLTERFRVALLSRSQSLALGGVCPPDALDGGIPGPDAGVTLPGDNGVAFDALRACGILEDVVGPGECGCTPCTLRYPLSGVRK